MKRYLVRVESQDRPGDDIYLTLEAHGPVHAQEQAVRAAFRDYGFRRIIAYVPDEVQSEVQP